MSEESEEGDGGSRHGRRVTRAGRRAETGQERSVTLPSTPESVRRARRLTSMALTEFGVRASASLADASLLIVTELVANAVRHARCSPDIGLVVSVRDGFIELKVSDGDPRVLDLRFRAAGEGLRTIGELIAERGGEIRVDPPSVGEGKVVSVRLPRRSRG